MIRYLKNSEIDRKQWDDCIEADSDSLPYGTSWYLDIMAPGWDALIDGDYNFVFPIPHRKKFGFSYIYTPVFLQKLGLFSKEFKTPQRLEEFIRFIPDRYVLSDLRISGRPQFIKEKIFIRDNYELSLKNDYDQLFSGYTSNCRRYLKLADINKLVFSGEIYVKEAIEHFSHGVGKGISGLKSGDYDMLESLMNFAIANGYGEIRGAYYNGELIYAILILKYRKRIILLLISTSSESRKRHTGYYVIDSLIKKYAGSDIVVDFAGSSIPGVASFNRSFGAVNIPYSRLYQNRLPWPIRIFK